MKNNKIKLIIFDLDGTLVDAYSAVTASFNYALSEMGLEPIDAITIKKSVGWGEKKLIQKFVPEDLVDQTLSIFRQHHRSALKSGTKFLPGAKALLGELKAKEYRLAIASNRPLRFTHIILKHLQIKDHFDFVVCADQVLNPKPAPDLICHLLEKCSLKAHEACYVGDMAIDVQAGNAAGVTTFVVLTGSCDKDDFQDAQPQAFLNNIVQVITHLI